MTSQVTHTLTHSREIAAPAEAVYSLVADVTRWPVIFGPTVYVDLLEHSDTTERFHIWATVNGSVRDWVSRRSFDPQAMLVEFAQERSAAPITSMGGSWRFSGLPGGRTKVVLDHHFTVAGDDAAQASIITAVNNNSEKELAALGLVAECGYLPGEIIQVFEDTVQLPGNAADIYTFVERSDLWPKRLPHVGRVDLVETADGVQDMEMDTVTSDGSSHTTRSVRLCFSPNKIVYKQQLPPALLLGHSGVWEFTDGPDGAVAISRHMVAINPAAIAPVLGAGQGIGDAQQYLRNALGANSKATLAHAGYWAESLAENLS
ncbi:aromatase/cyclase [Mycobacteroides salmoniphilum]|uniref:Polyketide cyclase n=1 Tax=Mycobacteroides salmoniphilum TaxID=404941 RepID=A0A4R8S9Z4_9MYCO|nr:aromatase/cyclase [Mycobacteroides salmoniphilum]TDZ89905.1 putative polyketide cyclase [Mycobacteroides salmoniphilum]TDZ99870.1 putative polyketide cyclase [Mycobacteroides salmoniphilum]